MNSKRIVLHVLMSVFVLILLFGSNVLSFAIEPEDLKNVTVRDLDGDVVTVKLDSVTQQWKCFKENGNVSSYTGLAPNEHGMWFCRLGSVDFTYNGFYQFQDETWYVKDGRVATDFSDEITNSDDVFIIENGKLVKQKKTNGYYLRALGGFAIIVASFLLLRFYKKAKREDSLKKRKANSSKPVFDKQYYAKEVGVENLHYQKKELLTDREDAFYKDLEPIADKLGFKVATKIRVADLVDVVGSKLTKEGKTAWHNIIGTHVDFVLLNKSTNKPQLLIELDDTTHFDEKAMFNDKIEDHVFQEAGYKLMRVYSSENLEQKIIDELNI